MISQAEVDAARKRADIRRKLVKAGADEATITAALADERHERLRAIAGALPGDATGHGDARPGSDFALTRYIAELCL